MIRDATADDYDQVARLAESAIKSSALSDIEPDAATMIRVFAVCCSTDNGFGKVVERNGKITAAMFAVVTKNQVGAMVASDLMTAGRLGIDLLLDEYRKWAVCRGASVVLVSNISGNTRYDKLIEEKGYEQIGKIYRSVNHGRSSSRSG